MKVYLLVTCFGVRAFSTHEKAVEFYHEIHCDLISPDNYVKVLEIDNPDYSESIKL